MNLGNLDPIFFTIGNTEVRYYSLMYIIGFVVARQLVRKLGREGYFSPGEDKADELVCFVIIGLLLGIRLGYVFFYNWGYYSKHINEIFHVWQGGLSFHGGVLGGATGAFIFSLKNKVRFFIVSDTVVITATQGIFFGRIGNFINGELYGRITDSSIGIIFKNGGPIARHPSQLYEAIGEGLILFTILWITRNKLKIHGASSALFLFGYGFIRFIIEYFREPDSHLGYYFSGYLTMGQILCLSQIIFAILVILIAKKLRIEKQNFNLHH